MVMKIAFFILQDRLKRILYALCLEMDMDIFRRSFAALLNNLDKSAVTSSFAEYLHWEWENKLDWFAPCNRQNANINTNMILEGFHKNLKYNSLMWKSGRVRSVGTG